MKRRSVKPAEAPAPVTVGQRLLGPVVLVLLAGIGGALLSGAFSVIDRRTLMVGALALLLLLLGIAMVLDKRAGKRRATGDDGEAVDTSWLTAPWSAARGFGKVPELKPIEFVRTDRKPKRKKSPRKK